MNEDELLKAVTRLPKTIEPPRDLWPEIEARLRPPPRRRWYWVSLAAAATVAALLVARGVLGPAGAWEVTRVAGLPQVGRTPLAGMGVLRVGEGVETDDSSRAVIRVGEIGHVEVRPGSRVRLLEARAVDHRLALDVGEIYARVSAPPRLFFVETPGGGVAIDLGCAYTLRVDSVGNGFLNVTAGAVQFEWGNRRSIVPFDTRIEIRHGFGPGVPVVADASQGLRRALVALEFDGQGDAALARVLALARRDDGLSLWHLLSRTEGAARAAVYERLAELVPPPGGVTREAVLRLDSEALDAYWNWLPHSVWLKGLTGS